METYKVVKNARLLKNMEAKGLITFAPQTLSKIQGLYSSRTFTCYYIDDAPLSKFTYNKRTFGRMYFSGCFFPYLVEYFNE